MLLPQLGAQKIPIGCVRAGQAVRAQAYTQPTPSSLQFPSPQNQNKMQALDKRYPHACGAGLSRWEGVGESSGWCQTPQSISHRVLFFQLVVFSGKQYMLMAELKRSGFV